MAQGRPGPLSPPWSISRKKSGLSREIRWTGPAGLPRLEGSRLWAFLETAREEGLALAPLVLPDPDFDPAEAAQNLWPRLARVFRRMTREDMDGRSPKSWPEAIAKRNQARLGDIMSPKANLNGKLAALMVLAALVWLPGAAAAKEPAVNLAGPGKVLACRAGQACRAELTVAIKDGFHINSAKPSDPNLIASRLSLKVPQGISLAKVVFPPAHQVDIPALGGKASVYDGKFNLSVTLAVTPKAKPGPPQAGGVFVLPSMRQPDVLHAGQRIGRF